MTSIIDQKIEKFSLCAQFIPGAVVVLDVSQKAKRVLYLNPYGCEKLGLTFCELPYLSNQDYSRVLHENGQRSFLNGLKKFRAGCHQEGCFTFFQQVKEKDVEEWVWYIASAKWFNTKDLKDHKHLLIIAFPMNRMKHIGQKSQRLVAENIFYEENRNKFLSLGEKPRKVLQLVALGKSSAEIAAELQIAVDTVNTHRRNIKRKLKINNTYEFVKFARTFDLI